jgi:hypothetical protein
MADAALSPEMLEEVYPFSTLKGGANVLIFPDLGSANIEFKLLAKLGGSFTAGRWSEPRHWRRRPDPALAVKPASCGVTRPCKTPRKQYNSGESKLQKKLLSKRDQIATDLICLVAQHRDGMEK